MNTKLNIEETQQQYILKIDKEELNSEYIINLLAWLMLHQQKDNTTRKKRHWTYTGSVKLTQNIDTLNLRDLAYE